MLECTTQVYPISDRLRNALLELNQCLVADSSIADKIIDYFDHYKTKLSPIVVSITNPDGPESIEKILFFMDEDVLYEPEFGTDIKATFIKTIKQVQGNISIINTGKKNIESLYDENGSLQIQQLSNDFFLNKEWENLWRTDIIGYYCEWCSFKTGTSYKIKQIINEIFDQWQGKTNEFSFPTDIIGKSLGKENIRELKILDPVIGNIESNIRVSAVDQTQEWKATSEEQWFILKANTGIQVKDRKSFTGDFKQLVEAWAIELLTFQVKQALTSAFDDFAVDQEILKVVEDGSGNSSTISKGSLYNWLIVSENKQAEKYKLQALKTAAGFIRVKAAELHASSSLKNGITQGLSLVNLISQELGVNTSISRTVKDMNFEEYVEFDNALQDIKGLENWFDPDWWPSAGDKSTSDQWSELIDFININKKLTGGPDRSSASVFSNSTRLFENSRAVWKRKWQNPGYRNLRDIQDAVDAFVNQLLLPIYLDCCESLGIDPNLKQAYYVLTQATQDSLSALEIALTHTKGIEELYKFSLWWHQNVQRINGEILVGDHQSWTPLFQPQAIGEVWAQPLCTAKELLCEGIEMNHCVGTYVPKCMWENSHIIALRNDRDKPLSTLEVKVQGRNIIAVQNKGAFNKEPIPLAVNATNQLLADLNQGNIQVDWSVIEADFYQRLSKRGKNDIISRIGYDWQKESSRDQAMKSWSGAIKRSYRNITYQEWVEKLEIKELVQRSLEDTGFDPSHKPFKF